MWKFKVYVTIRCSCPLIPVQFPFICMPNELSIEGSMSKLNVKKVIFNSLFYLKIK